MKPTLSKQTIQQFFAGANSPLQKALVEEWLTEPANQELFYRWLEEWENENPQFIPDTDSAWQRSRTRQKETPAPVIALAPQRRWLGPRGRAGLLAASVVLMLALGGWLARDWLLFDTHTTAYGQLKTITLPDGSRVTLNANSTLQVSRGFGQATFGQSERNVWLAGEAEFSVIHTRDNRRFVVHTPDQLEVDVLGTEFIVYSRSRGSKVVLNRGKVSLRSGKTGAAKPLVIAPGDVVTVSQTGQFALQHRQPLAPHAAWKHHGFVFDGTSVAQIAVVLNETFGVTLLINDPQLARRTLGGTFQVSRAEDLLRVLTEVLDVRVSRVDDKTFSLTTTN